MANGAKLIPSVTRVFRTDREMYVFLQAYAAPTAAAGAPAAPAGAPAVAADGKKDLVAYVTLYREGKVAYQGQAVASTPIAASRLGVTPLSFTVPLGGLAPGEYQCQVTVLDAAGNRAAFWQGQMALVN